MISILSLFLKNFVIISKESYELYMKTFLIIGHLCNFLITYFFIKKMCTRNTNSILYYGEKFCFKITEPPWKGRYNNHTNSFINPNYSKETELSKKSKINERNLRSKTNGSKALPRNTTTKKYML